MAESGSKLQDTIFSLTLVDTHSHIRQWPTMPQPMTAYELFNGSGCLRQVFVASGALSRQEFRAGKTFPDWPSLSDAIRKIRTTAYYRMLLSGLKSLYNMDFDELDEDSLNVISGKLAESYASQDWYRIILREKAGFGVNCQDYGLDADRSLFTPVVRLDRFVRLGMPTWGKQVADKYGEEKTASLEGLLVCLRQEFHELLDAGAAAIKSNETWGRTLNYEEVDEATVSDALVECREDSSKKAAKTIGDYMMGRIAKLCGENGIPLQFHTGPAGGVDHVIEYGNPLNLTSLILRNPETKFVIFHAGGPFVRECAHMAVQYPNVYLDLCGVLGRESLRHIIEEWMEYVPHTKFLWGTDVNMVEEAYAVSRSFRQVLADLLEDRVKSGYMSYAPAEDFARGIAGENAKRVLRIPASGSSNS